MCIANIGLPLYKIPTYAMGVGYIKYCFIINSERVLWAYKSHVRSQHILRDGQLDAHIKYGTK